MKRNVNNYVISMQAFLINYLCVDYTNINIDNINHYDLMELNLDGVERLPINVVKDEDIICGRVLLVEASGFKHKGKQLCAYIRPDLVLLGRSDSKLDQMMYKAFDKDRRLTKSA